MGARQANGRGTHSCDRHRSSLTDTGVLAVCASMVILFLAVLGLHCCTGFSLVVARGGYSLMAMHGLLISVASLVAGHGIYSMQASAVVAPGLLSTGSAVAVQGLSCSPACGILPDQGLYPCILHQQTHSLPLSHQGSPEDDNS